MKTLTVMNDYYFDNNGVPLHYQLFENSNSTSGISAILLHGALGSHESWTSNDYLMHKLLNSNISKVYILNLRGHGLSGFPQSGFTVEDHVSDIKSLIQHESIKKILLVSHSLGVPYSIGHALQGTSDIISLISGDYVALVPPFSKQWLDSIIKNISEYNVNPQLPYKLLEEIKRVQPFYDVVSLGLL